MQTISAVYRVESGGTGDLSDFLRAMYAPSDVGSASDCLEQFSAAGRMWDGVGLFSLVGEVPFWVRAKGPRSTYLLMSSVGGDLSLTSGNRVLECSEAQVVPISCAGDFEFVTRRRGAGALFCVLDGERVGRLMGCSLGKRFGGPVDFHFAALSADLAGEWHFSMECLSMLLQMDPVPRAAVDALLEFLIRSLLLRHSHNYSDSL